MYLMPLCTRSVKRIQSANAPCRLAAVLTAPKLPLPCPTTPSLSSFEHFVNRDAHRSVSTPLARALPPLSSLGDERARTGWGPTRLPPVPHATNA